MLCRMVHYSKSIGGSLVQWKQLEFSKNQVIKAERSIKDPSIDGKERQFALSIDIIEREINT